jgi:hypothetical protein
LDSISNEPENDEGNQMLRRCFNQRKPIRRLSSVKDLAVAFGTTEWFWRKKILDGVLPYVRFGRKVLLDSIDVEKNIQKENEK